MADHLHAWNVGEGLLCAALLAASLLVYRRRVAPPLWVSLVVGLILRAVVALVSRGHTPNDVGIVFARVARLTLAHQDAVTHLPRYFWNFIPMTAYVLAGESKTHLPWQLAVKLVPIVADLVTIWLVGLLVRSGAGDAGTARLLYAISPIAVLVTAHHGQVEPIAAALGLGALCLAQRDRPVAAGATLGLAVAAKTWPALFLPGVLRDLPRRRWPHALGAAAVVVGVLFSSTAWELHDSLGAAGRVIASYRSYLGTYGWSGLLHLYGPAGAGYSGPNIDQYQRIGTAITLVALTAALVYFRRNRGPDLTLMLILVLLAVAAGFGGQYLLWPVALVYARATPRGWAYLVPAAVFTMFFYLVAIPAPAPHPRGAIRAVDVAQVWLSLPVIVGCLVVVALSRRDQTATPETRQRLSGP